MNKRYYFKYPKMKLALPVHVELITFDEWLFPPHSHDHYEIIVIRKGKGMHYIGNYAIPYQSNAVFMLHPDETHSFRIDEPTTYMFVKFTQDVLTRMCIESNSGSITGCYFSLPFLQETQTKFIELTDSDLIFINLLMDKMLLEFNSGKLFGDDIIQKGLQITLSLLTRGYCSSNMGDSNENILNSNKTTRIAHLIRQSIYEGKDVKIATLASQLNLSEYYLRTYFKKQTGITLQAYILKNRLIYAMQRMQNSNETIFEISDSLGFFDESYFCKQFRKEFGISPGKFRKKNLLKSTDAPGKSIG